MTASRIMAILTLVAIGSAAASAHDPASHKGHNQHAAAAKGGCDGPELACALTATPAFDQQGRLWLIWTAARKVWVARQAAPGGPFAPSVAVTPEPVNLDNGPDSRPKLAIGPSGNVAIAFAVLPEGSWNGVIYTAASSDDGLTFTQPARLDPASPGHRFEALQFLPDGQLLAASIDKANAVSAKKSGQKYAGAALALAWSQDAGVTFTPAKVAVDQSCECCRIGIALSPQGEAVIAFRNIFDGTTRDHAIVTVSKDGTVNPVRRISTDAWVTDSCPHQGPALAISTAGIRHVVWYTAGTARKGVFYARAAGPDGDFSPPLPLGRAGVQVSRPQVLAASGGLYLAWKEFDGETTSVVSQSSRDDGLTWTAPVVLATSSSRADHPQLVAGPNGTVFVSWLTDAEGHRMLAIGGAS